jgi:hypothetical protein
MSSENTVRERAAVGSQPGEPGEGPKYWVNIEGETYPWDDDEITVDEIRDLGDLPGDLPVLLIDLRTNEQRTLDEGEVIELRPGMGFAKKIKFKRG